MALTYEGVAVPEADSTCALIVKWLLVQTLDDEFSSVVGDYWDNDNGYQRHVSTLHDSKRNAKGTCTWTLRIK